MAREKLAFGDHVLVPWSSRLEVRGTVQEIYGPAADRQVVVLLTPEVTGTVVGEPTTVSMPIGFVTKVSSAA